MNIKSNLIRFLTLIVNNIFCSLNQLFTAWRFNNSSLLKVRFWRREGTINFCRQPKFLLNRIALFTTSVCKNRRILHFHQVNTLDIKIFDLYTFLLAFFILGFCKIWYWTTWYLEVFSFVKRKVGCMGWPTLSPQS